MATLLREIAMPERVYPAGSRQTPDVLIPDAARAIYIELSRCTSSTPTVWPDPATTIDARLDVSLDGGATWQFLGGITGQGGIFLRSDGVTEVPLSTFWINLPDGTGRRVRANVTIAGGSLRTQLAVELRD